MEESSSKKQKSTQIDLSQISSLKRVTDLFPKGLTSETAVKNLPTEVARIISDTIITKNIPNLVNSTLGAVPQNSIASDVKERNANLHNMLQNQLQTKLVKRFKPFNIVTILLTLGWIITIILLNVL
ncbi:MAG: hypothetical protein EU530_11110 [Promethearchaeota archaeon]|nr:MAG: hypothetical protein EU530_11110 [Candidatus Lokiarchaeota archaeon]